MRKFVNLFEKGNLTPKERYLMLVQNNMAKGITGEESLTEADKSALQNWHTKNNKEVKEWNKYKDGDELITQAGLESEFIYLQAKAEYFRKFFLDTQLTFSPYNQKIEDLLEILEASEVMGVEDRISTEMLEMAFRPTQFFKKVKQNDEVILDFTSETARAIFKESREKLIDYYAKLLAFQKIFKRLSITYEVNLAYFIDDHLENVVRFLEENNDALSKAGLKMKDDLFIDIDSILPDAEILEIWNKDFTEILGDEF